MGKLKIIDGKRRKGPILLEIITENPIISSLNIAKKIRRKGYKIQGVNREYEPVAIGLYISKNLLDKTVGKFRYNVNNHKKITLYYPLKNKLSEDVKLG